MFYSDLDQVYKTIIDKLNEKRRTFIISDNPSCSSYFSVSGMVVKISATDPRNSSLHVDYWLSLDSSNKDANDNLNVSTEQTGYSVSDEELERVTSNILDAFVKISLEDTLKKINGTIVYNDGFFFKGHPAAMYIDNLKHSSENNLAFKKPTSQEDTESCLELRRSLLSNALNLSDGAIKEHVGRQWVYEFKFALENIINDSATLDEYISLMQEYIDDLNAEITTQKEYLFEAMQGDDCSEIAEIANMLNYLALNKFAVTKIYNFFSLTKKHDPKSWLYTDIYDFDNKTIDYD